MRLKALIIATLFIFNLGISGDMPEFPFEKYVLNNGLTVILHTDHSSPIAAVEVWYKVGSKDEKKKQYGITRLVANLQFSGSKNVADGEHLKTVFDVGGRGGSRVTPDQVELMQVIPNSALKTVLWMEADRMRYLSESLTPEKLNVAKESVLNKSDQGPNGEFDFQWMADLFELSYDTEYPYHHPLNGIAEDIKNLKLKDVKSFLDQYFVPNNAILIISGDFDMAVVKYWIKSYFAPIKAGPAIEKKVWPLPLFKGPKTRVKKVNAPNPMVFINFPYPSMGSRNSYIIDIAAQGIGNGVSSRLYQELVVNRQLATNVEISPWSMQLNSHFMVIVTGAPGVEAENLANQVKEIIFHCKDKPFSWSELKKSKNKLKLYLNRFLDTNQGKNFLFGAFESFFGKPELITQETYKYDDIKSIEVDQAIKKYLVPENASILIYKPIKK